MDRVDVGELSVTNEMKLFFSFIYSYVYIQGQGGLCTLNHLLLNRESQNRKTPPKFDYYVGYQFPRFYLRSLSLSSVLRHYSM